MRKISCLFFLILFVVLSSCEENEFSEDKKNILKIINKERLKETKALIIIPLSGCGSCINDVVDYSLSDYDKGKVSFIIVESNKKNVTNIYNKIDLLGSNFFIDSKLILQSLNVLNSQPVLYFTDNGKFTEKIYIHDGNSKEVLERVKKAFN